MALVFLRHTRPDVADGVCYGMTDLALKPTFVEELEVVCDSLPPVQRIACSPLQRCQRLAQALAHRFSHTAVVDDRLREMDFGSWEGQRWDAIARAELDEWAADFLLARPHGGESVAELQRRVDEAMEHYDSLDGDTLLVTHAGVIKAAFSEGPHADNYDTAVPFGGQRVWRQHGAITSRAKRQ